MQEYLLDDNLQTQQNLFIKKIPITIPSVTIRNIFTNIFRYINVIYATFCV